MTYIIDRENLTASYTEDGQRATLSWGSSDKMPDDDKIKEYLLRAWKMRDSGQNQKLSTVFSVGIGSKSVKLMRYYNPDLDEWMISLGVITLVGDIGKVFPFTVSREKKGLGFGGNTAYFFTFRE